jgi:hypothetical protein
MIQHLCDRCQRSIDPDVETSYHVQVDIRSEVDGPTVDPGDDDLDQLSELHLQLEHQWDNGVAKDPVADEAMSAAKVHDEYHLCSDCYQQWIRNPVGQNRLSALGFSPN